LILAPPEVRRFVVAHEVAHLVHLNHGPEFKSLEAKLFGPGLSDAKAKLKRWGPRLRRIGRGL
jgi:predicted metal-dependent hydrolase